MAAKFTDELKALEYAQKRANITNWPHIIQGVEDGMVVVAQSGTNLKNRVRLARVKPEKSCKQ